MVSLIGKLAFVVGVLFALIGGIWWPDNGAVVAILLIAGIIIGFLNISGKEAPVVLSAAVALIILGIWGGSDAFAPVAKFSTWLSENVMGVVSCFAMLTAPAAIIIAIKAVISTANR